MTPAVDVVIPLLNARPYIRDAVDSALAQTGVDVRVIVVDAGSTDGGPAEVASWGDPRVLVIPGSEVLMAGAARNRGVLHATAEWLAFLDADDLWPRDRTAQLMPAITEPSHQIAFGHHVTFPDGAAVDLAAPVDPPGHPAAPTAGTLLMSREVFARVGPFDAELRIGEFIDWIARLRSLGVAEVHVPVVSLLRRSHATNTSRARQGEYAAGYVDIVRQHLRRSREAGAVDIT